MDDDVTEVTTGLATQIDEIKGRLDSDDEGFRALKDSVDALAAVDPSKVADQITALDARIAKIEMYLSNILPAKVVGGGVSFSPYPTPLRGLN